MQSGMRLFDQSGLDHPFTLEIFSIEDRGPAAHACSLTVGRIGDSAEQKMRRLFEAILPPKRRFWKVEPTFQNAFSKHFSRV